MCSKEMERKFFSEEEKLLLISLVESKKHIIECKKTDGVSIRQKQETWEKISSSYNCNNVHKRNPKQLKKLWDNIKQKTRKADTERKYSILKTGGGPPPPEDRHDPITDKVRSIVPTIDLEIDNDFDSLAVFKNIASPDVEDAKEKVSPSLDHNYTQKTGAETDDIISDSFLKTPKGIIKDSTRKRKIKKANQTYINEEAALRKRKIEEAIEQQKELHEVKLEAAREETNYWKVKTDLLSSNSF